MDEKDRIITSLKLQLQKANSKINALEQEVALLKYQNETHSKNDQKTSQNIKENISNF